MQKQLRYRGETVEINKAEYLVRGLGYIKNVSDLESAVITYLMGCLSRSTSGVCHFRTRNKRGPIKRAGAVEVSCCPHASNPLEVINNVKKIAEMDADCHKRP